MQKIVVITGPTGSGKTKYSLELCKRLNGEVINCDASQFKKYLNIGTAKIDLLQTNIKHHLIDIIEPTSNYSICDFQKTSRALIDDIISRGKIPFLVGGSGLYINSCIYDYDLSTSKRSDEKFNDKTTEELFKILQEIDYQTSLQIHPNNRKRVLRAIEVCKEGKSISLNKCSSNPIYDVRGFYLDLDREQLYQNINLRTEEMLKNGWITECTELIKNGYNLNNISDIGYKEINSYLNGEISLDSAKEEIQKATRHYAKRQITWCKNKMSLYYVNAVNFNESISLMEKMIKEEKNETNN